jgi:DNA-binding transcriptional MerR regulator
MTTSSDSRSPESAMGEGHRSIGEVLALLQEEFPDVTISKIRFLESQGLIDPERTPSGYRKFYEVDVVRLRWILQQQKDHFLPLKVIRGRLEQLELGDGELFELDVEIEVASEGVVVSDTESTKASAAAKGEAVADDAPKPKAPRKKAVKKKSPARAARPSEPPVIPDDKSRDELDASISGASLTREELARAAGLEIEAVNLLEEFGLIAPNPHFGDRGLFDEESLVIAQIAAEFGAHGIEPRHLRMYRAFAEREVGIFEQVLLPQLRLRNPEARVQARESIVALATLGRRMRTVYVSQAARQVLAE